MLKDSKIYIAGHRGLVGSAIHRGLIERGYTNIVCRTSAELDLRCQSATRAFFEREKPEYVILAAAYVGGIMANNIYRADFIFNNLQIQQNVIGESFRNNVKKLLFLGSTCIYPRECEQPMSEEALLTSPLEYTNEPYAIAKIAGMKMCESFNIQYGTNYISVMPTNLYGLNDNFDLEKSHVLPAMIRKIYLAKALQMCDWDTIRKDLQRLPIGDVNEKSSENAIISTLESFGIYSSRVVLWGSGKPTREFLWSDDMADASIFIMESVDFKSLTEGSSNNDVRNCHINIGTGEEISIFDLAHLIASVVGYGGEIGFDTTKPDGTMRKLTNPSKLHALGWHHKVDVADGVRVLYEWYKKK